MHTLKVAPRSDVAVLLICYGLTVIVDMVAAVAVGVVLAALLFMRRMAEVTRANLVEGEHPALPQSLPSGIVVYDIAGPLFFGAAQKAMATLGAIGDRTRAVILRMDQVPVMDATGLVALESALQRLNKLGCWTAISGVREQPAKLLRSAHIERLGQVALCQTMEEAIRLAKDQLQPPLASAQKRDSAASPA